MAKEGSEEGEREPAGQREAPTEEQVRILVWQTMEQMHHQAQATAQLLLEVHAKLSGAQAATTAVANVVDANEAEAQKLKLELVAKENRGFLIEILSQTFDKGAAYTQVVLLALFAGAFSLLSQTAGELPLPAIIWICILLTVALAAFAVNEVFKMVHGVLQGLKQRRLLLQNLDPFDFQKAFDDYRRETRESSIKWVMGLWVICLAISGVTATAAACLLFYNLMARVTALPQWPL